MTDSTIKANDLGIYELRLTNGVQYTIDTSAITGNVNVLIHTGTQPVYAKASSTVAVRDNTATIVLPRPNTPTLISNVGSALSLISASDALVSVYKA